MSPNFNKATSRTAKKTLVNACTNDESTRETMITTIRIVQELKPRYDNGGTRAIYDVSGQGLPYERFVLERGNDMRWYIAE
jgi:U3 small nucleolar RNA-associated protein 14